LSKRLGPKKHSNHLENDVGENRPPQRKERRKQHIDPKRVESRGREGFADKRIRNERRPERSQRVLNPECKTTPPKKNREEKKKKKGKLYRKITGCRLESRRTLKFQPKWAVAKPDAYGAWPKRKRQSREEKKQKF